MEMNITYKNPWHKPGFNQEIFTRNDVKPIHSKCGRGMIIKVIDKHYDYLVDGKVVAQRGGKSMDMLEDCIKAIDGESEGFQSAYQTDRIREAYNNG
jgi:hypothetical protein